MRKTKQTLKTNCSFTKISTFTLLSSIWLNIAHLSFCLYDLVYDMGALPGPLKWISGKQNCVIKALIIYSLLNKLKFIWMSLVDGTTTHTNTYTCWVLQTQLLRTYTGSTFLQGVMLCFFSHAHVSCHSSMVLSRQRHEADVDWCSSHTYTHITVNTTVDKGSPQLLSNRLHQSTECSCIGRWKDPQAQQAQGSSLPTGVLCSLDSHLHGLL